MSPWAWGRKNWLFADSLRIGQQAANIMTLIQSAKLNGLDPYIYLSDVLKRLPTHKVAQIEELLPHRWKPDQNQTIGMGFSGCLQLIEEINLLLRILEIK